jgi:hypothetical protein
VPELSIDAESISLLSMSNPFPGLRPYEEEDSNWFFGRGREINDLLKRLRRLHFVAIVGASGCGKSSVIRAGVLPQIRDGFLDRQWSIAVFRPGERPIANLAEALAPQVSCGLDAFSQTLQSGPLGLIKAIQSGTLPEDGNILILVDQFEELFQFAQRRGDSAQEEVKQFLKLLLAAATSDDVPVHVVVTMRLEWLNECAAYPGLAEAINEGIYLVPQMTRRQFHQAILGPLEAAGGNITTALLDRMLNDLDGRSDQLPVLQHALMRLWERRSDTNPIDMSEYEAVGTLSNCLSAHAEKVFEELNDQGKRIAESLFRSITQVYKGRKIRRPRPVSEILAAADCDISQLESVISAFSRAGRSFLVTTTGKLEQGSIVDVSHEALIRQWTRLSGWVDNEAEVLQRIARLEADAAEWDRDRKSFKSSLYRGFRLRRAMEIERYLARGSATEAFLKQSRSAEFWALFWIRGSIAGAVILLIAVAIGWVRLERQKAQALKQSADAQQKAAMAEAQMTTEQAKRVKLAQEQFATEIKNAKGSQKALDAIAQSIEAPRVYLQSVRGQSEDLAKATQALLQKNGYTVPGIELVAPNISPAQSQVRYFHKEDFSEASKIAGLLKPIIPDGVNPSATANPNGVVPSGQFEVWIAFAGATKQQSSTPQVAPAVGDTAKESQPNSAAAVPAAPIVLVSVLPEQVQQGGRVTLTWQTQNATQVAVSATTTIQGTQSATNLLGSELQVNGSLQDTPRESTTYDVTVNGPGGTIHKTAHVEVTPAVATAPAPVAVVPLDSGAAAIKAALNRYADAYGSESLDKLKQAWPGVTKSQEKNLKYVFDQFNAIRLTLACRDEDIHIDGDSATATCRQSAVYTQKGKVQPEQVTTTTFKLRDQTGVWVVESVQ